MRNARMVDRSDSEGPHHGAFMNLSSAMIHIPADSLSNQGSVNAMPERIASRVLRSQTGSLSRRATTFVIAATIAVVALVLSGCGSSGSGSGPNATGANGKRLVPVSVLMAFKYTVVQWYSIYDYGKQKGFFADHGVNPTFTQGLGSASAPTLVSSGKADVGAVVATANAIQAVANGTPVTMIGQDTGIGTIAVLSTHGKPIAKPSDLVGKKIGYDPTSYAGILFKALLSANHVPTKSVTQINVSGNAYAPALKQGQIDGYVSAPDTNVPLLESIGESKPTVMKFADYGIDAAPQEGLIASNSFIKHNPAAVKGFMAGYNETVEYLLNHPEAIAAAAAAGEKAHPGVVKAAIAEKQITLHLGFLRQTYKAGTSPLKIDEAAFGAQVSLLAKYGQIKKPAAPSTYFTNQYLPAS